MFSSPILDFRSAWHEARAQMRDMTASSQFWFWFWLAGPLIFLIERSPADFWMIALDMAFIWHCIRTHNWGWMRQFWVRATLIFWAVCVLSAVSSAIPQSSLIEAVGWIRFPLYAAAAQVWFGHLRAFRLMMLASMFIGMMVMSVILSAEILIEPKNRLEWPYGDAVPGGYLGKATLPAFSIMIAFLMSRLDNQNIPLGRLRLTAVAAFTFGISIIAGERMNLLIRLCSALLSGLVWKASMRGIALCFVIILSVSSVLFMFNDRVSHRFGAVFFEQNPIHLESSPYWAVWRAGPQAFETAPILGIGPGNLRHLCPDLPQSTLPGTTECDNHPHQFYLQLLGETGAIGLFFGLVMIGAILHCCWRARHHHLSDKLTCPMAATAFVIPLAFFWPTQSTADFFGQWNNLFIWLSLGFALMQNQNWRDKA